MPLESKITLEELEQVVNDAMSLPKMAIKFGTTKSRVWQRLQESGLHEKWKLIRKRKSLEFIESKYCKNCGQKMELVGSFNKGGFWFCPSKSLLCQYANASDSEKEALAEVVA